MDRKEKNRLKAEISEHIDLGNGRYKDQEIEQLHSLVENRDTYNGTTQTHRKSYKSFDSEDTYRVEESDVYTFRSDDTGIRIEQDWTRDWDDGQHDTEHHSHRTGREILNVLGKVFRK